MKKLTLIFAITVIVTTCVISCMGAKTEEATPTSDTLAADSTQVDSTVVSDTTK